MLALRHAREIALARCIAGLKSNTGRTDKSEHNHTDAIIDALNRVPEGIIKDLNHIYVVNLWNIACILERWLSIANA